jgi:hypothetical protein
MAPMERDPILAGAGLPASQAIQHEAGLLGPVICPWKPVGEIVRIFGKGRHGPAPELPS